ncbi:DUF58 domain-containing protein [Halobacteriovorax sp. HLS]|uniref:DUF58 domain-containing protein n=1 Tax=Halobacteriovorax sp. HLS TaxID=2234000 RepID=UPI000FD8007D|nr:DUF58 domain-containing protein [Halobacteriovorax sp. HLS]
MNLQEVRRLVGSIKSTLFKNSNSFSIGMLKSHFKGSGLQFKEHMVYSHGDDVRFIDWKVSAKTQNTFIKTFEEERNVEIVVVLDLSPSMFMGYKGVSKLQAALEICCLLFLLSSETNDYVQVIIAGEKIENLPKSTGEKGIALLLSKLEKINVLDTKGKINLSYPYQNNAPSQEVFQNMMKYLRRNKEVVFLSDFVEFSNLEELKKMSYRKHIHCFRILSPLDEAIGETYEVFTSNKNKGEMSRVHKRSADKIEDALGKRIKKLRVQERYLESFIKEMM